MRTPPTKQSQPVPPDGDLPPDDAEIVFDFGSESARDKQFFLAMLWTAAPAIVVTSVIVFLVGGFFLMHSVSPLHTTTEPAKAKALAKNPGQSMPVSRSVIAMQQDTASNGAITSNDTKSKQAGEMVSSADSGTRTGDMAATTQSSNIIPIEPLDRSSVLPATKQARSSLTAIPESPAYDNESATQDETAALHGANPAPPDATEHTPFEITTTIVTKATTAKTADRVFHQNSASTPSVAELLDRSLRLFQNKEWGKLVEISNKILRINPTEVSALTNRAAAKTELGWFMAALADCDSAMEIAPDNSLAVNNRGYVYEKMGDFQNAILDYERACALGIKISCHEATRLKSAMR